MKKDKEITNDIKTIAEILSELSLYQTKVKINFSGKTYTRAFWCIYQTTQTNDELREVLVGFAKSLDNSMIWVIKTSDLETPVGFSIYQDLIYFIEEQDFHSFELKDEIELCAEKVLSYVE